MPVTIYDQSTGQLTSVQKVLKEHYEKPFLKALDHETFMLQFFKRKSGVGHEVQWKIQYDGNNGIEWYDEDDSYGAAGSQSFENAASPFKRVRINVKVSRFAQAAMAGEGSYIDILSTELEGAMNDLKDAINDRILEFGSGAISDTEKIDSLGIIFNDGGTSGYESYAGIDRTSKTWWKPVILKNGSGDLYNLAARPLTVALMQNMRAELETPRRKAKTSHILTSRTHFNQYADLFADRRRWPSTMKLDLGVEALDYDGIPVVPVVNMANGRMFFIQSDTFNYYVLTAFETEEVPSTSDNDVFAIKQYAQLVCRAPHKNGAIVNLAA